MMLPTEDVIFSQNENES